MSDENKNDTPITRPIGNTGGYKEGTNIQTQKDGTVHQTNWYSNNYGSSRTSTDYDKNGKASNKHTKKNR